MTDLDRFLENSAATWAGLPKPEPIPEPEQYDKDERGYVARVIEEVTVE